MAIAYRSGSTAGDAVGGNLTITKPSGVVDNDILIAVLYREAGTWTLPSGWSQFAEVQNYNGTAWITAAYKRASSEGSNYTFDLSTSTWRVIAMAAFSGCITSGSPVEVSGTSGTSITDILAPSITTTTPGDMLVVVTGNYDGTDVSVGTSGYTQGAQLGGCEIFYRTAPSTGATGTVSLPRSSGSGGAWGAIHFALLPDTGGTSISVTDTGTGSDSLASLAASLTITDAGAGVDSRDVPAVDLSIPDSGAGADTLASILASLSVADSGSGAESITAGVIITIPDSGSGSDTPNIPAISLTIQDSGAGVDLVAGMTALLLLSDSGSGAETVSSGVVISIADAGAGVDSITGVIASLTVLDTGAGAESVAGVTVAVLVLDSGFGIDWAANASVTAMFSRNISISDFGPAILYVDLKDSSKSIRADLSVPAILIHMGE